MDKKEIEKAIAILIAHNEWRRGGEKTITHPKELGEAIDTVIEVLSQPKEVEPKKEVEPPTKMDKKEIEKAANEYVESIGIKIDTDMYSEYANTDFKAGVEWALSQTKEVEVSEYKYEPQTDLGTAATMFYFKRPFEPKKEVDLQKQINDLKEELKSEDARVKAVRKNFDELYKINQTAIEQLDLLKAENDEQKLRINNLRFILDNPKKEVDLDFILNSFGNDLIKLGVSWHNSNSVCELTNQYIRNLPHLQKPVESEWISVEDRLPKIEATYLVTLKSDTDIWIETAYLFNSVFSLGGHRISDKITHWMPLPQPPKNNSNN